VLGSPPGGRAAEPGPGQAEALARLEADLPRRQQETQALNGRLLLPGDPGVDDLLAPLPYPVALWVRGTLPPAKGPRLAIVGSRQAALRARPAPGPGRRPSRRLAWP